MAKELLYYDLANELYEKNLKIMGDKCNRFLEGNRSPYLSAEKINNFLKTKKKRFSSKEIKKTQRIIEGSEMPLEKIIRGHFLTGGINNLLRKEGESIREKKISISNEHLFGSTVEECHNCNGKCQEHERMGNDCIIALSTLDI